MRSLGISVCNLTPTKAKVKLKIKRETLIIEIRKLSNYQKNYC